MEVIEATTRAKTTANDKNQDQDNTVLMSSKPLHRFVQRQPRVLGIVIVIFGCAELLMGFQLAGETETNSTMIYIPFWQGVLFLVCGNLSIFTEIHPSKKMVTVCLAMYIVSLLGIIVSFGYRIFCLSFYFYSTIRPNYSEDKWEIYRMKQLFSIEGVLFTSSLCVSVILIFLCVVTRLALKSTHTQVVIHHIPAPQRAAPSN